MIGTTFALVCGIICLLPIFTVCLMLLLGDSDHLVKIINAIRDAVISIVEAGKKRKNDHYD